MEPLSANDPRTIGEFAVRARLGSGGMGRVYLGFSRGGRAVAIKVVHPELARDPEFLRRFGREVASARAVSGVYTAPVVASGLHDDPPWMATAFVPGPPLADVVIQHGPLPEAAVWRLAAGLAEALHAVHACNLVHRDLKPSNVLMAPDGPHVIDFGISRAFEGTVLTSAGMVVGTPGYMSPEQAEGQPAGPPSDVFSLGCVLAYAATGLAPFGAGSAASVLYRVVTAEPDLRPVPDRLRQVIEACLAKRPAERAGLAQLSSMISALGPATPLALGSFWPEPVASFIAADQAYPTPTQVSSAPASPGHTGSVPASQPPVSPAQSGAIPSAAQPGPAPGPWAEPVPTLTSLAGLEPAGSAQPSMVQPGLAPHPPTPGGTGHAPMVADGYYAAATRGPAADGSGQPQYAQPQYAQPPAGQSWSPQYPGGQQPSWPGANAAGPQAGAPGTQYAAPQQSAAPWPPPAQSTPWPQQPPGTPASWLGGGAGAPGPASPLDQYTPGRRRPTAAEIPGPVRTAARLMYLGAAATVLYVLLGLAAVHHYNYWHLISGHKMAIDVGLTAVWGGGAGVVCWIVLATSSRRGHGWTRVAATILLAIHTVGMLIDMVLLNGEVGVKATSAVIWGIGLAAVVLLWSQDSRAFFRAWRKR
jgi:serine/threonine protein kinase